MIAKNITLEVNEGTNENLNVFMRCLQSCAIGKMKIKNLSYRISKDLDKDGFPRKSIIDLIVFENV
jgi:hypothetical protein